MSDGNHGLVDGQTAREYWKPGRGRKPLPPSERRSEVVFVRATQWMRGKLGEIQAKEQERTGRKPTLARVARLCIQLGIMRYEELKQLPSTDR